MKTQRAKSRLALMCGETGVIIRVLQNHTTIPVEEGHWFEEIVEEGWRNTAQRFVSLLQERQIVWGWRMTFSLGNTSLSMHVAGVRKGGGYTILGAASLSDLLSLFASVMQEDVETDAAYESLGRPFQPPDSQGTARIMEEFLRLNAELANAQRELARKNAELQDALMQIKSLSGLVTICASCKKIRDERGDWNQLEHYIQQRSDARFTHGFCPDCMNELYGEWLGKSESHKDVHSTEPASPLPRRPGR